METIDLGAHGTVTAEKFAVVCEYDHGGVVTHLADHEGRVIGARYFAAEDFAFVQESDPACTQAYVVTADGSAV